MSIGHDGRGFDLKLMAGATSTSASNRVVLDRPCANWAFQVVNASCNATVLFQGGIATSSDATLTTMATWASSSDGTGDASGLTQFVTDKPCSQIVAVLSGGASSGGGPHVWVAGVPG